MKHIGVYTVIIAYSLVLFLAGTCIGVYIGDEAARKENQQNKDWEATMLHVGDEVKFKVNPKPNKCDDGMKIIGLKSVRGQNLAWVELENCGFKTDVLIQEDIERVIK